MRTAVERTLQPLLELTARVGSDPLLTQASTGNISIKLDGVLWIKTSGKWMANAIRDDVLTPLKHNDVNECLRRGLDPSEHFSGASLETAMHAVLPHNVVLHLHSVNGIAWAVRQDARAQLQARLHGLSWQWIPYVPSGLPLAREIARAHSADTAANLFILGNHGLVLAGGDAKEVEGLLNQVESRLDIPPRATGPADRAKLAEICDGSPWILPADSGVHALGTDCTARAILAKGLLYPCQAIFSGSGTDNPFRAISYFDCRAGVSHDRPFLVIEGSGVVINRAASMAEVAMLSGLAQVVQRLNASAPIRYLTEAEVAGLSTQVAYRYRELANMSQATLGAAFGSGM